MKEKDDEDKWYGAHVDPKDSEKILSFFRVLKREMVRKRERKRLIVCYFLGMCYVNRHDRYIVYTIYYLRHNNE